MLTLCIIIIIIMNGREYKFTTAINIMCRPEICGRRHFGVRVRPRPQILRPNPRPHMSANGVRGTGVKYSSTGRW